MNISVPCYVVYVIMKMSLPLPSFVRNRSSRKKENFVYNKTTQGLNNTYY